MPRTRTNAELTRLARVLAGDDDWALDLSNDIGTFNVGNSSTPTKITVLQSPGVETIPNAQSFSLTVPNGKFYDGANGMALRGRLRDAEAYPFVLVKESYDKGYMGRFAAQTPRQVPTQGPVTMGLTLASSSIWYSGDVKKFDLAVAGQYIDTHMEFTAGKQIFALALGGSGDASKDLRINLYKQSDAEWGAHPREDSDTNEYRYRRGSSAPSTPTGDNPTGWSSTFLAPTSTGDTYLATRTQSSSVWGAWSVTLNAENLVSEKAGKALGVAEYSTTEAPTGVSANETIGIAIELSEAATAALSVYVFVGDPLVPAGV